MKTAQDTEAAPVKMSKATRALCVKLMSKYNLMVQSRKDLLETIEEELKGYEKGIKECAADLIEVGNQYKHMFDEKDRLDLEEGYLLISKSTIVEVGKKFSLAEFQRVKPEMVDITLKTSPIKKAYLDKDERKELKALGIDVNTEETIKVMLHKQPEK
jgi:hypothetical protein